MKLDHRAAISVSISFTLATITIGGCKSLGDTLREIDDICSTTPSESNLVKVRDVDWEKMGKKTLTATHKVVRACEDHFVVGSSARSEMHAAFYELNRIEGCELKFTSIAGSHLDKDDLFDPGLATCAFDYVNNDSSVDSGTHPCHPGEDTSCSSWAINTCRHDGSDWGGSDKTRSFVISANANCYGHYSSSSSTDYPMKHGILHESAHAWGMNHTNSWKGSDKKYISTMQGKQIYLTAVDVAYLREHYPESMNDHRNYVAGSKTRFAAGGDSYTTDVFWEDNPDTFVVDGAGSIVDCDTGVLPVFSVSWFNTGNIKGEAEICGVNRIFLREESSGTEIDLHVWRIATMPSLSQDQWRGAIDPNPDDIMRIDPGKSYELVYRVNGWGTLDELTDTDNELSYPVFVRSTSCP